MNILDTRHTGLVLATQVDVTSHELTCQRVLLLAGRRKPAYICYATAHMLVEATRKPAIMQAYNEASIVNPDGTPVGWCLRMLGHRAANCVSGPLNTPLVLREAERHGLSVGFYGGRPETLAKMLGVLRAKYPDLIITYACSPPFRPLSDAEQERDVDAINASGVRLLFVGLGSPKQELWMFRHHSALNCVCLGVGAVFEFMSGEKLLPPLWVQRCGLTWLVRLYQEPRRLAGRNLYSPVFVMLFAMQLIPDVCRRFMRALLHGRVVDSGRAI